MKRVKLKRDMNHKNRLRRCVVIHDAPSFFFIDYKNRFIFFKLRYFEDFFGLCVRNI